jgi:hypothetical protein
VLVTPVERVGIEVEDAPFLAVEMVGGDPHRDLAAIGRVPPLHRRRAAAPGLAAEGGAEAFEECMRPGRRGQCQKIETPDEAARRRLSATRCLSGARRGRR